MRSLADRLASDLRLLAHNNPNAKVLSNGTGIEHFDEPTAVRLQPLRRIYLRHQLPQPESCPNLDAPGRRQPRHGRRIRRRQAPIAQRPLQQRDLRNLHQKRPPAGPHPGRRPTTRPLRLAPTGPLLAGPYRQHALRSPPRFLQRGPRRCAEAAPHLPASSTGLAPQALLTSARSECRELTDTSAFAIRPAYIRSALSV
jgi:hypothetical protein